MRHRFLLCALLASTATLFAQQEQESISFQELYDEPYSVNKLFVAFQPLYGELFVANINAGFGIEATYFLDNILDFKGHFRTTYGSKFFDFSRAIAKNDNDADNHAEGFNYMELGATYHVRDFEENSTTRMLLFKTSYSRNRWASRMPESIEVPCKVRMVYGARLGAMVWNSSTDINRALRKQGLTHADLGLPEQEYDVNGEIENVDIFTSIYSKSLYAGGSMAWIRNIAVEFEEYESGVDDHMFTVFADLIYAPSVKMDDIVYTEKDEQGARTTTATYSVEPIGLKKLGFRIGMDGRFNRTLSWAYGAEMGYRPGIAGRSFFALFKISFPVYGTDLEFKAKPVAE